MKKIYDRFADEYIDESEKNPYAPPERYTEITDEVLVENAARWFLTALKRLLDEDEETKDESQLVKESVEVVKDLVKDEPQMRCEFCKREGDDLCWDCPRTERSKK